jgi:glycosyltransferase involved in cell wall biosynthesis
VPDGALHVCYCHAPFRYAWHEQNEVLAMFPRPLQPLAAHGLRRLQRWDLAASRRVDVYIANSKITRARIRRIYGRDAAIVHPPVETHRFAPGCPGESLLVVGEIVRHKRVHVALAAARLAGRPIQVVGDGPERAALARQYPEAEFLGRISDGELASAYSRALAVVVPSVEEFGITAVEAQAAGRPVIAAAQGGALETVVPGKTGMLATTDDVASFARAMREIDTIGFDPAVAAANADRFSVEAFQHRIDQHVGRALWERQHATTGSARSTQRR